LPGGQGPARREGQEQARVERVRRRGSVDREGERRRPLTPAAAIRAPRDLTVPRVQRERHHLDVEQLRVNILFKFDF